MKKLSKSKGVSLIEVIIASSIIATISIVVFSVFTLMNTQATQNTNLVQASMLVEEGVEAIRSMRDFGWSSNITTLTSGTTYGIAWNGTRFVSTTPGSFIDSKFDRTFVLSDVNRDSDFNIVLSGGTLDTGTKKVVVTVSWRQNNATTTKSLESYIFNSFND